MNQVRCGSLVLLEVMKLLYGLGEEGAIGPEPGIYKVVHDAGQREF